MKLSEIFNKKFYTPDGQPDFHDSKRPKALKISRFISWILTTGLFLYYFSEYPQTFFLFLSFWGVFLTFFYYFLSSLSYKFFVLKPYSYLLFEVIWPINFIITLIFWCYLFPMTIGSYAIIDDLSVHGVPILLTILEFSLNKVLIYRPHVLLSFVVLLCYLFFVLLPYTLFVEVLYPGITFKNLISYGLFVVLIGILFASIETARFIRLKLCNEVSTLQENMLVTIKS